MDRENIIKALELCEIGYIDRCYGRDCPYYEQGCTESLKNDILALLKEQEAVEPKTIPAELKLKMWNAFYAEENECEKKFVEKEECLNWFIVYRPLLQKGFNIAINAIAEWEGR